MFTPLVRILLAIGCITMAVYFYIKGDFLEMGWVLLCAGLFIYGYFKSGTVYLAFQYLKKEKYDKAAKLISKIKNPEILSKSQKNYYHFTQGMLASNNKEWEKSSSELTKALNIGLRTKNDTSIVLLNLANVEFERKNYEKALAYISEVREFDLKPLVKTETDRIESEINLAQQHI